ncbi:hypothetical protein ACQKWADRAFT_37444 [Trichoderma austrokoningii]
MDSRSVNVRPQDNKDSDEIETFIESLIGCTVQTSFSKPPIFSFQTTNANVEKIKEKFGLRVIIE